MHTHMHPPTHTPTHAPTHAHVHMHTHTHPHPAFKRLCFITGPPSPPRNIMYSDVTNTSVFIMWEASTDNGNRADLIYTITQNVTDDIVTTANTSITLMGLLPFVSYEIKVTADNGVSSQDDNEEGRTLSISVMMLEGGDYYYN